MFLLFIFLCYANQPYIVVKICACVMRYHLFILFLALKNGKELSCQINISIQNETVLWQYIQFVNPIRLFQIILKTLKDAWIKRVSCFLKYLIETRWNISCQVDVIRIKLKLEPSLHLSKYNGHYNAVFYFDLY